MILKRKILALAISGFVVIITSLYIKEFTKRPIPPPAASRQPPQVVTLSKENRVVVVSDFTNYPALKKKLNPLIEIWKRENREAFLIDMSAVHQETGRDMAEKLRNLLAKQYEESPFKYLFLLDIRSTGTTSNRHVIPARIFADISFVETPVKIWTDYYYSDLAGQFDLNGNNIYEIDSARRDYLPGSLEKQVVVGRIIFDEDLLDKQIEKYVATNVEFRKLPQLRKAVMIKSWEGNFRESSSDHWPTGDVMEEIQTLDKAFFWNEIEKKELLGPEKDEAFLALQNADLVYFYGHGDIATQQIKVTDPNYNSTGVYVSDEELRNVANLKRPLIAFFQGCETGKTFRDDYPSTAKTIAQSFILNNNPTSVSGLASIANSITASFYPSDFADLLQGAFWYGSLAEQVSKRLWDIWAQPDVFNRTRLSLVYFGDPTLPFPKSAKQDKIPPRIEFSQSNERYYVALDDESGVESIKLSWDDNPWTQAEEIFPNSPQILNRYDINRVNIRVKDRAGNVTEVEKGF